MKKLIMALALVFSTGVAMAQNEATPTLKYSVATNSFWSNWFITVGGSYNANYSSQELGLDGSPFKDFRRAFGAEITLGKWFSPGIGVRIKGAGVWGQQVNNAYDANGAISGQVGDKHEINNIEVSVQTMFNLNNLFAGYKHRVWNIIPYFGVGFGHHMAHGGDYSPIFNVGLNNQFNLSKRLFLNLDIYYQIADADYDGNGEKSTNSNFLSDRDRKFGASLSLGVNLGKVGWEKTPDVAAIQALNAAQLAALNEQLAAQEAENARLKALLAKPAPKPQTVVQTVKEVTAAPVSVFFNLNSSRIASKKDLVNVQSLVDAANNSGKKIVVTGYADSKTGSAAYNQTLSEKRAAAVADALVAQGVARENIEVVGAGGVDSLNPFSYNRRAVVEIK